MNIPEPTLTESNWDLLLRAIRTGRCTPIIGPGASAGILPPARQIARQWAQEFNYPFEDSSDLMRVAQFVSVSEGPAIPKASLARQLERFHPNFSDPTEPYSILASLPLPLYITTNYDDFLLQALSMEAKKPHSEGSRWNSLLKSEKLNSYNYTPSVHDPMVFHLYGRITQPESLVLTEDDYLDFLISSAEDENTIPNIVQMACSTNMLLFLGYGLDDWDFRVLFRTLSEYTRRSLRRRHIAVMLSPIVNSGLSERAQNFYRNQFSNLGLEIYWGTIREFTADLKRHLEIM